jgi:photosystem II stability/assembly factor-like uncharacterized protein
MTENPNLPTDDAVYDITASSNFPEDQTLFAARASGLYRSVDSGNTWAYALADLALTSQLGISSVALAPNYAEMPHVFAAGPGGILRSLDGGETWQVIMLPSPPPYISHLRISPNYAADGIVFATTLDDGIFRSSNRGTTWTAWNFGLFDLHILSILVSPDFQNDKTVYLGTESGIFCSVNGGLGWRELEFPVAAAPVTSLARTDTRILAGTEAAGLFSSIDDGSTWDLLVAEETIGSISSILTASNSEVVLLMNTDGLKYSQDQGQTWNNWAENKIFPSQPLAIAAPLGITPDSAPLFIGFVDGDIQTI